MEQDSLATWVPSLIEQSGKYSQEDWEDWLRWDPAAEPLSPKDSSQHDSLVDSETEEKTQPMPLSAEECLNLDCLPPMTFAVNQYAYDPAHGPPLFAFGSRDANETPFNFDSTFVKNVEGGASELDQVACGPPDKTSEGQLDSSLQYLPMEHCHYLPDTTAGYPVSTPSLGHSPHSNSSPKQSGPSCSKSPEPVRKRGGRKRKSSAEAHSVSGNPSTDQPPPKKTSHNVIEKKYRNNLNDKITELRNSVPSLRAMSRISDQDAHDEASEDLEGLTPAHKLNKGTVLAKATEYIRHLEKRNKTMVQEMTELKTRLGALERAMARSPLRQSGLYGADPAPIVDSGSYASVPVTAATTISPGMLRSLDGHMPASTHADCQQYSQQDHDQPAYEQPHEYTGAPSGRQHVNARGSNGMMGKLVVGTLAGVMILEGIYEQQQGGDGPSQRDLFSSTTKLVGRSTSSSPPSQSSMPFAGREAFALLKVIAIVGAFVFLVSPIIRFGPRVKRKSHTVHAVKLCAAPSLASPVELRRKAWLTAVQTVWVPRHFLLEVIAVTLKMTKLSLRRLIGSDNYTLLTGLSKDEEAARVKAWDIAIDAQLAGGDSEVSYHRLLLTLMESGTLPDAPMRLMMKTVHFRVFFWEIANVGYGRSALLHKFYARVARIYWDSAKKEQQFSRTMVAVDDERGEDPLPNHLAALLELGCSDVLTDEVIQRAYNLAWDKSSCHKTRRNRVLDSVVEDHAIRSPLDAVAAWHSTIILDRVLVQSLGCTDNVTPDVLAALGLALRIAPPASSVQRRALVVKALLDDRDREGQLVAAIDTLPTRAHHPGTKTEISSQPSPLNVIASAPIASEIRATLTLVKCLSLLLSDSLPSRMHAVAVVNNLDMNPCQFSLLTFAAAHRMLAIMVNNHVLFNMSKPGLAHISSSMRVWASTKAARRSGLNGQVREDVVDQCLIIAKMALGWEEEYGKEKADVSTDDQEGTDLGLAKVA
ncbi:Clr6 histone deacetylase associated PHD protein-2 Cph2 [Elasticomyces elasticus]|nr:Clr6 histone deacetylase associated PHD protein-2 Cph2 [Elasticomyces elasticus]